MDVSAGTILGVACFHFVPEPLPKTPHEWDAAIKDGLESVASINDVQVGLRHFGMRELDDWPQPDFDENLLFDFNLHPQDGSISFTVNIPVRDQERLNLFRNRVVSRTEQFRVATLYDTLGPSTIVICPDKGEKGASSEGVVIVREFLERELERASAPLKLITTGPSPFHADIRVDYQDNDAALEGVTSSSFSIKRESDRGYEQIEIKCADKAAYADLIGQIYLESQFFYSCAREQGRNLSRAYEIAQMADGLIKLYRSQGFRNWCRRLWKSGAHARDLLLTVIQAKLAESASRSSITSEFEELKATGKIVLFEQAIAEEVASNNEERLKTSEEVAQLLEGGRKKEFEVLVLSTSTLLGGFAGALAALIAK